MSYLVTLVSSCPPNLSIAYSNCDLDLELVPCTDNLLTNWDTELLEIVSCLVPALTVTVTAAWLPSQLSVATVTPLDSVLMVVGLEN